MGKVGKVLTFLIAFYLYYSVIVTADSKWESVSLIIFIAVLVITIQAFKTSEGIKLVKNASIEKIDQMPKEEFMLYMMQLYKKIGYGIELIDRGKILENAFIIKKNGLKTFIKCKQSQEAIDAQVVQKLYKSMQSHHCKGAIMITNSHYTKEAYALAEKNTVLLMDREQLEKQLEDLGNKSRNLEKVSFVQE